MFTKEMKAALDTGFLKAFGTNPERYFSAPGRTEIGGNHQDHQLGCVLAAAVNLDTRAAVRVNGTSLVRILSQGYQMVCVDLDDLAVKEADFNTTVSLVRGVAARFMELGCTVEGFDAYMESSVLPGSGLSSSAAFEVLVGTIINGLFNGGLDPVQIAIIGQYAENVYFGKPCGLMDQMASSVGGMVAIDFHDPKDPVVEPIHFDFASCGHALCIIDTRASHADLTDEYAAITRDMGAVSRFFGKTALRQVSEEEFYAAIPALRKETGDRAVLRGLHFFEEYKRCLAQVQALKEGDFDRFLKLITESGHSSFMYLQNVTPAGYVKNQDVAMSLALCEKLLGGKGAYRVHGGGFAGTVQAFVPAEILGQFKDGIEAVFGAGTCHVLSIRKEGGVEYTG